MQSLYNVRYLSLPSRVRLPIDVVEDTPLSWVVIESFGLLWSLSFIQLQFTVVRG